MARRRTAKLSTCSVTESLQERHPVIWCCDVQYTESIKKSKLSNPTIYVLNIRHFSGVMLFQVKTKVPVNKLGQIMRVLRDYQVACKGI